MPKSIFKTSDTRKVTDKMDSLAKEFRRLADRLNRIQVEVELLREANLMMVKTIKKAQYQG